MFRKTTLAVALLAFSSTAQALEIPFSPPSGQGKDFYGEFLGVVEVLQAGTCPRSFPWLKHWSKSDVIGSMSTYGLNNEKVEVGSLWDAACKGK